MSTASKGDLSSKGLAFAFLTTGGFAVANLVTSLARNKGLAVELGPVGFGQWSQIMAFAFLVQTAATLGITGGVARYVAEYRREGRSPEAVVTTALIFLGGVSMLGAFLLLMASPWIARWTVDQSDWWWVVGLAGFIAPLVAVHCVYQSALKGFGDYKGLAKAGIFGAFASLAIAIVAALTLGVKGVAIFVTGSFLVQASLHAWQLRRHLSLRVMLRQFELPLVRKLLGYGGVAMVGAILATVGNLAGRSVLLHEYGPESNGYYQAMSGLTLQILPVFLSGITLYVIPRLGGVSDKAYTGEVVTLVVRAVCLLIMPLLALGVVFREWFLQYLFSAEFLVAAPWLPVQFTGDLFLALAWACSSFLLPTGRLRAFLICESTRAILFFLIAVTLLRLHLEPLGVSALAIALVVAYAVEVVMLVYVARRAIGLRLGCLLRNIVPMLLAWCGVLAVCYLFPLGLRLLMVSAILGLYWWRMIERREWGLLVSALRFRKPGPSVSGS